MALFVKQVCNGKMNHTRHFKATTRNPFIYDVLGMTIPNLVTEQGSSMTKFRYSSWMTGLGVNPFVQLWQSRRNRHRNVVNFVIEVKLSSFTVEVPPVSRNFCHKSEIKKNVRCLGIEPRTCTSQARWLTITLWIQTCYRVGTLIYYLFE